jgi:tryptophan synthase alpha subunit
VGFGIKSRQDVLAISNKTKANGVIIGSALIQKYFDLKMNLSHYIQSLNKFIKEVKITK